MEGEPMTIFTFAEDRRRKIPIIPALFAVGVLAIGKAEAADSSIPNFAGDAYTSWYPDREDGDNFMLPQDGGPGPVMSHPDYPYRPDGPGDDAASNPTYRFADLRNPILTPWAIDQMEPWNEMVLAGDQIPFTARERCYPPGVPGWNVFRRVAPPMVFFSQAPEKVWMIWRGDNQVRRIYLNVPHSENPNATFHGESVGHYEGNALVVDTIAISDHPLNFVDNYRTPHTDQLHVIERFEMVDANTIDVEIYVEDPGAFTIPWKARQILTRYEGEPIEESICAEIGNTPGNLYFNLNPVRIPQAAVPDF
jgi:hypothetical protein